MEENSNETNSESDPISDLNQWIGYLESELEELTIENKCLKASAEESEKWDSFKTEIHRKEVLTLQKLMTDRDDQIYKYKTIESENFSKIENLESKVLALTEKLNNPLNEKNSNQDLNDTTDTCSIASTWSEVSNNLSEDDVLHMPCRPFHELQRNRSNHKRYSNIGRMVRRRN